MRVILLQGCAEMWQETLLRSLIVKAVWPNTHCTWSGPQGCHALIARALGQYKEQDNNQLTALALKGCRVPPADGVRCHLLPAEQPAVQAAMQNNCSPAGMRQQPLTDLQPDMSALLLCKGR